MIVKINMKPVDIVLVPVYMPTTYHDDDEIEKLCEEINKILHHDGRGQVNAIVMGDFNSIVGKGSRDKVVGLGKRNERGKMLIDFCKQHDLVVMNTCFKKRKTKLYTSKSPGDYILVKQRFKNSIRDVKTLPGADIDSDHNLLVAEEQTRLKSIKTLGRGNQNGIWNE